VEPIEKLYDDVMTVGAFCYLGDRMNASGGCEENWLDEISRIWRNITWEKVFAEVKRSIRVV